MRDTTIAAALLVLAMRGETAPPVFSTAQLIARIPAEQLTDPEALARFTARGAHGVIIPAQATSLEAIAQNLRRLAVQPAFLEVDLSAKTALLTDDGAFSAAVELMGAAAARATTLEVQGVVINLTARGTSLDGVSKLYDDVPVSPFALGATARELGREMADTIERTFPRCLRGVYFNGETVTPLWWAWLDGFMARARQSSTTHTLLFVHGDISTPSINHAARMHLGDVAWASWMDGATAVLSQGNGLAGITSKLDSAMYTWVDADSPEQLPTATPIDALQRVGTLERDGQHIHVLRNETGAAIVALEGLSNPLVLSGRTAPVFVTNLASGERKEILAVNNALRVEPSRFPILIEELPLRDWVLSAALWLEPEVAVVAGATTTPIRFGWSNSSDATLEGSLMIVPPGRASIQPKAQTLTLEPGQRYSARGTLTANAKAGDALSARMVFAAPGVAPVTRDFSVEVLPLTLWKLECYVALNLPLVAGDIDSDGRDEILGVTAAGALLCVNASGGVAWESSRSGFSFSPAIGRYWNGQRVVAAISDTALILLDQSGTESWRRELRSPASCTPVFANLNPKRGEELAVGLEDGRVTALRSDSRELWSTQHAAPVVHTALADRNGDVRHDVVVVSGSPAREISLVDPMGNIVWRVNVAGSVLEPPAIYNDPALGQIIALKTKPEKMVVLNANDGGQLQDYPGGINVIGSGFRIDCELDGDTARESVDIEGGSILRAINAPA